MRQAGRYLPEYRELRGTRDILEACREPDLVVEATLQPIRRMDLDAAILFSDIMVPLAGIGVDVRIESGSDRWSRRRFAHDPTLDRLRPLEPEADVPHVLEAVRLLRKELSVPLIGFAGAPFTLASYLIEGRAVAIPRPGEDPHAHGAGNVGRADGGARGDGDDASSCAG